MMPCRYHPQGHSDEARRISDATRLAWTAYGWDGFARKWMAFRLQDGSTNNRVYPTKLDAMRDCDNEYRYMFLHMSPGGMSDCEAEIMLKLNRIARNRSFMMPRLDLPHGGPDLIPRIGTEKIANQIRALKGVT